MTNKYILFPALALALVSCSQTDEPGTLSEPKAASFSAQIDNTASRAAGTQWSAGDAIGISGVSAGKSYSNVQFVTASGDGNFAVEGDNIYYQTTDEVTFTAYYPYSASLGADGLISASTFDQNAQPTFDFLWAQATGSYSTPEVNFNFTHRMAQFNLVFTNGNDVDLSDLTFSIEGLILDGTFDTASGEAKVAEGEATASLSSAVNDAKASMIIFPQTVETMTVNATVGGQQYVCTLNPGDLAAGTSYNVNITVKKTGMTVTGSTITDWTASGNFNGTATMPVPHKGDFFYSDGTYSTSLDASKTCIGIVFWTPVDANPDPNAKTPASLYDDKVMNTDFPNCTHGLVVALNDASSGTKWIEDGKYRIYNDFQNTDNFSPRNKAAYRPIATFVAATDESNYILGYQNTKILKAYKEWNNGSAPALPILDALEEYSIKTPTPGNTTGWFIPSPKELSLIISEDHDDIYISRSTEQFLLIRNSLKSANGHSLSDFVWSSSESNMLESKDTFSAISLQYFDQLYTTLKDDEYPSLRLVLAF